MFYKLLNNGKYQITVDYIGRDGKRKYKKVSYNVTGKNKKEIEKKLLELRDNLKQEVREAATTNSYIKVKDFIPIYANEYMKDNLEQGTYENYLQILQKRLFLIQNKSIGEIKPVDIQMIINNLKQKYVPSSVKRNFIIFNGMFKYALKMQYIKENPCSNIILPKNKSKEKELRFFSTAETKLFLSLLEQESLQFKAFFYLSIFGGFRRQEILALTWDDIDFKNNIISINKAVGKVKNGQIIKNTKTKASIREIVVPNICIDVLNKWKKINKNKFIFIQENGDLMYIDTPTHKFKEIIEKNNKSNETKLPLIRLHDLRHTSATLLLANNVDIETVSNRLGHAQCSTTLNIYGHAMKESDIKASKILASLF